MLIVAVSCDIAHIANTGYVYKKPAGKKLELPKIENDVGYLPPLNNHYLPPSKDYLPPITEVDEINCVGDECDLNFTAVANEYE
jgi:hypothetical protein